MLGLLLAALSVASNAVVGNWNSSDNDKTAKVSGMANLFFPDDVITLVNSASSQEKSNTAALKVILHIKKLTSFL